MIHALAALSLLLGILGQSASAEQPCTSCAVSTPVGTHSLKSARGVSGAWFYKSESLPSKNWVGIRAEGQLPRISLDPKRYYSAEQAKKAHEPDYKVGPLDRPSVYLGGSIGGAEVDAGLSWDRVYDAKGHAVVPERFAFRPYWRMPPKAGAKTEWHNPPVKSAENLYFEPGQDIQMSIEVVSPAAARPMRVALSICDTGTPARRCFKTQFNHPGDPRAASSFKRVNSIDQFTIQGGKRVGCEGKRVVATQSRATEASWSSVTLLERKPGSVIPLEVPMTAERQHTLIGKEFGKEPLRSSVRSLFKDSPIDANGGLPRLSIIPAAR